MTSRFDCVFWAGDLNFRLEKERERLDKTIEGIKSQDTPNFGDLIVHDELFRIRNEGVDSLQSAVTVRKFPTQVLKGTNSGISAFRVGFSSLSRR